MMAANSLFIDHSKELRPLHGVSAVLDGLGSHHPGPVSLLDSASIRIASNLNLTLEALRVVPYTLYPSLLSASLATGLCVATKAIVSSWPYTSINSKCLQNRSWLARAKSLEECHNQIAVTVAMAIGSRENRIQDVDISYLNLSSESREQFLRNLLKGRVGETSPVRKKQKKAVYMHQSQTRKDFTDLRITMNLCVEGADIERHLQLHRELLAARIIVRSKEFCVRYASADKLTEVLQLDQREGTTALLMDYNGIGNSNLERVLRPVQNYSLLTRLCLKYNRIDIRSPHAATAIKSLGTLLFGLPSLRCLGLAGNRLSRSLPEIISRIQQPLMLLDVSNCMLTLEDLDYLARSPHSEHLQHLLLGGNFAVSRNWGSVEQLLCRASGSLVELDLTNVCQGATQTDVLCGLVKLGPSLLRLKSLELQGNHLTVAEQVDIVLSFVKCASMAALRLSFPLESKGETWEGMKGRELSEALQPHSKSTAIEWFTLTCWTKRAAVNPSYLNEGSRFMTVIIYEEDFLGAQEFHFPIS
ncbi:leucine-rich repeat-containing protein 14B-like [Diadema antillarum]|uniref:leucine-rich repeat-containing protein 14B-like n=1 Tax=Diadema antillarum TaxID=105358 RepID=UPI003A84049C